jgi:hypothetical protein
MQREFDFEQLARHQQTARRIMAARLVAGQTTTQNQRLVLMAIHHFGEVHGKPCFPSIPTLAAEASLKPRTTQRAIADLIRQNLIAVQLQRLPSGTVGNVYGIRHHVLNSLTIDSANDPLASRSLTATRSNRGPAKRYATRDTDTPPVTPIRHSWRTTKDLDPRSSLPPPPPTPPTPSAAAAAAEILGLEGIGQANQTAQAAIDRGLTVLQVVDAVATAKAHRRSFQNWRAALVAYLRTGDWPAQLRRDSSGDHRRIDLGSRTAEPDEPAEIPSVPLAQQLREILGNRLPDHGN